jgi:nitrile hydratase accessory protein
LSPRETPNAGPVPAEPVFAEPWQAQAFAIVVALHEAGLFTWDEWAATLSAELHRAGADPQGHDYYAHWVAALGALLDRKGVAADAEVDALQAAWQRAAHATPHGEPIVLENDPERGAGSDRICSPAQ